MPSGSKTPPGVLVGRCFQILAPDHEFMLIEQVIIADHRGGRKLTRRRRGGATIEEARSRLPRGVSFDPTFAPDDVTLERWVSDGWRRATNPQGPDEELPDPRLVALASEIEAAMRADPFMCEAVLGRVATEAMREDPARLRQFASDLSEYGSRVLATVLDREQEELRELLSEFLMSKFRN